jgi:hypothetical protein
MPQTTFHTDNVRTSATGFPKLKLDHGQIVRLVCIEQGPTFEWVHQLQKPRKSPVTGKAVMVTRKRKSGEEYQDYDQEFVGAPICLGDPDILAEKGVDPDHCPLCEASTGDEAFRGPQRRFAIHVLKYSTKTGSGTITEPFSVETLVWVLSDNRFSALASIFTEHAPDGEQPDPRKVDLVLGPCTNASFQNYEIKAGAKCEMLQSQERLQRAMTTYQENHAPDLTPYCGRVTERRWIEQMIEEIMERYAEIRSGGAPVSIPDVSTTLDSSLLDSTPSTVSPTSSTPKTPAATAELATAVESVVTADEAPAQEADPKGEDTSFEDLLASLTPSK